MDWVTADAYPLRARIYAHIGKKPNHLIRKVDSGVAISRNDSNPQKTPSRYLQSGFLSEAKPLGCPGYWTFYLT